MTTTESPKDKKPTSPLAWTGFGLAAAGFVFAFIPYISGTSWLFCIPAIVLGIIALAKKSSATTIPIIALVLASLGWVISIPVFLNSIDTQSGSNNNNSGSSVENSEKSVEEKPDAAGIGDTVTNEYGVAFTVNSVECGIPSLPGLFDETKTALGQFCVVKYTVTNDSKEEISLSPDNVTGYSGDTEYKATDEIELGGIGEDHSWYTSLNPGLTISGETVIDIPIEVSLDKVAFSPSWSWSDPISIQLK